MENAADQSNSLVSMSLPFAYLQSSKVLFCNRMQNYLIFLMKTSMMIIVVIGNKILWSLILSKSKTMKRLCNKSSSLSEFSR